MYVVVGCSSTHNKLGLASSLFIIILLNMLPKKNMIQRVQAPFSVGQLHSHSAPFADSLPRQPMPGRACTGGDIWLASCVETSGRHGHTCDRRRHANHIGQPIARAHVWFAASQQVASHTN